MIKHIFCDLDGTLFSDHISKKDIEAIEIAQKNGIKFSIATGRVYSHSINIVECAKVDGYLICENGARIYNSNDDCIYKGTLSDYQIKNIIDTYNNLGYINKNEDIIYFKYDGNIILPIDGKGAEYFIKGYLVDSNITFLDTYDNQVGNIGVLSNDKEKLKMLVDDFKEVCVNEFDVYISSPSTMNIVPKGISKFEAIKMVCKDENISIDEIVTIGDSPNDISMLKNVKMSFAMSNADESVKSIAGFETPSVADAVNMVIDLNNEMK